MVSEYRSLQERLIDSLNSNSHTVLKEELVEEEIDISGEHKKIRSWLIFDTHFKKKVTLYDIQFADGLKFVRCIFDEGIIINNCSNISLMPSPKWTSSSIVFDNCTVSGLTMNLNDFNMGIHFLNESRIGAMHLSETNLQEGLVINNSYIETDFRYLSSTMRSILIENSEVGENLETIDCNIVDFKLISSKIKGNFLVSKGGIAETTLFSASTLLGSCVFMGVKINGRVSIEQTEFQSRATLAVEKVIFYEEKLSEVLIVKDSIFNTDFTIEGFQSKATKLKLEFSSKMTGNIIIQKCVFKYLTFQGDNQNTNLFLDSCEIENFIFNQFTNNSGRIYFNSCKAHMANDSNMQISGSILNYVHFSNFNFDSFSNIRIEDSSISEIGFSGVTWFDRKKLNASQNPKPERELTQSRETYRQLKQLCEKQGDRIQSLVFQSEELRIFRKLLAIQKREHKIADRISLLIGGIGKHGQDWLTPLTLAFFTTFFLFIGMLVAALPSLELSLDLSISGLGRTSNIVHDNIGVFWQLLNPVHGVKDLFGNNLESPGWVYFIDGIQRIFLGIFLYQMISAFRKFIR